MVRHNTQFSYNMDVERYNVGAQGNLGSKTAEVWMYSWENRESEALLRRTVTEG